MTSSGGFPRENKKAKVMVPKQLVGEEQFLHGSTRLFRMIQLWNLSNFLILPAFISVLSYVIIIINCPRPENEQRIKMHGS